MTYIPSYDDLTPSIPDIAPGEVLTSVARLVPERAPVASREPSRVPSTTTTLFAALHGKRIDLLMAIARDFSPRIERHSDGDVVLDVAGLGRLLGDAHAIGAELARAGATRVAVASTQATALLLARARTGVTVVGAEGGDVDRALRDVPLAVLQSLVSELRTPIVGDSQARDRLFETLRRWGLRTIGEFAALPADDLAARFGQDGVALQRFARGIDPRPLVADPSVPRFIETMELEWPIEELEPLSFVFARLLDPLSAALERADRGAAAIRLDLRLVNRTVHARCLQLPAAMRDPRVLRTLLLLDLESHPPTAGVDVVTLEADPAPSRIVQYSLLERAMPAAETLATLNARLGALVGEDRCGSPVLLDSHRPDAFVMARFTPDRGGKAPRDAAAAASAPVLRRFRPAVAIRVVLERGRPVRVHIDRRGMPGGRIVQAAGPWRTSGAWWTPERWDRDEWDVEFDDGVACRIYRDRIADTWFLDGVVD